MPRRTIKTEETIVDPDNSPTVVAYRTGQLEKAVPTMTAVSENWGGGWNAL